MPPMWQFRVDFKLPAYFRTKQNAEITEKAFSATEARHNYEAAGVTIQSQIRQTYTLAATARKLIDLYQKSVIPGAQLALESSMAGYQTGTLDFLSLFSNRTCLPHCTAASPSATTSHPILLDMRANCLALIAAHWPSRRRRAARVQVLCDAEGWAGRAARDH